MRARSDDGEAGQKDEDTSNAEPEDDQWTPECVTACIAAVVVGACA